MLTEFMLVSGWAFWIVLAGITIFEIFLVVGAEDGAETHVFATSLAVAALIGAVLFTDAFAGARVAWLAIAFGAYLALGGGWSVYKWYAFVVRQRDDLRASYAKANKTFSGNETWELYSKDRRPTAASNKARIITWMTLWPFSLTWDVLTWPRRAFVWLYKRLTTTFDRISARIFAQT